jgi:hypothetical protein
MPPYLPRLKFPPWVPDLSDQESDVSANVMNVVPRADGWGPFNAFVVFTAPLPAPCRGFFFARNSDGSVSIFAGTAASKLYLLNNSTLTWTDVSNGGGTYGALSATSQWDFEQFNNLVIAVHNNVNPQVFNLASPITFADLGGSPPQAAFVAIVNRFVVLTGVTAQPYRAQWSDLDNPTQWTAGVGQADFQDLPDGGLTKGVAGFDLFGVIFQDNMLRLMTYAPGSPVIFTITKITSGDGNGIYAPYGYVIDQSNVFWISQEGFKMMTPGGAPQSIGKEVVDRFFFGNVDSGNLQLVIATTDPAASRMYFAFKSSAGQAGLFDIILIYDWKLQRWSRISQIGEFINVIARPGLTLENMDQVTPGVVTITGAANNGSGAIRLTVSTTVGMSTAAQQTVYGVWNVTQIQGTAPFLAAINNKQNTANSAFGTWPITIIDGTHVDLVGSTFAGSYTSGGFLGANIELIPFSFDTVSTSTIPSLGGWDSSNRLGFFNGPAVEAQIETGEQGTNEKRLFVKGFRVICDAPSIFGSVSYRDNPQATYKYTSEVGIDQIGNCLVAGGGIDTRYSRARIRIPAGTIWTYAMAVEPDGVTTGSY